jgi:hypothetical protein
MIAENKISKSSIDTTISFLTADGVPDYTEIKAVIEGIIENRSDGFGSANSQPESTIVEDDDTRSNATDGSMQASSERSKARTPFIEGQTMRNLASLDSDDAEKELRKRKSGDTAGGRRRKSRRHKKRRSTLKRRRMKRRRTRKGKKRRHTRKH